MSTTIDNRIVEMTFDNGQFEQGIKVSLKSLDALKKGLDLDKATNSLANLEKVADKFNLSTIEDAVQSLSDRFSTLGIIGMTALENITNRAVNAGVALAKSLSIDQISSGMSKYEAETQAVATMQYAIDGGLTEEGTKRIYEQIEKLQKYSDETSYSFSTMVDNMGKFVASGVDLEKAEVAMEGVANWAAKSGVSAQSANFSRALYNLSQAMGQGTLRVQDWMSIENAQMATQSFKDEAIKAAVAVGTLTEKSGKYYTKATKGNKSVEVTANNMRTTLEKGWFTGEVLTKVLGKYADRTTEFGMEAFLAAQKARTFTDAIEATKDAVSTGWARSFRIIFGDIEKATTLFTNMANGLISVTDMVQNFRNSILEAWAANKGRDNLIKALENIWDILRGIGWSFVEAFGLNADGLTDELGKGLADLTTKFKDTTDAILGLFDVYKKISGGETKKTSKTFKQVTSDLTAMQEEARKNAETVQGMINTGTVKMSEKTAANFQELADAYKDLDEYIASGEVDADELAKKLDNINRLLGETEKTRNLMGWKQKALQGMLKQLKAYKDAGVESSTITKETEEQVSEEEEIMHYRAGRLIEIFSGLKSALDIFSESMGIVKDSVIDFAAQFEPLITPVMELAGSLGLFIGHIYETGKIQGSVAKWMNQATEAFSPLTDKINDAAKWISYLQDILLDRNKDTFLNGPEGEKIKNVLEGIRSAADIAVTSITSTWRAWSTLFADFILPLIGPVGSAILDVLSGVGKILTEISQSGMVASFFKMATDVIVGFANTVKERIVSSPIFQRAKSVLSTFFKMFSQDPKAALNYMKHVGNGLLSLIRKTPLYQQASTRLKAFADGIKNTFKNSRALKRAGKFVSAFFKLFQKDPKRAMTVLKLFGKSMIKQFQDTKLWQSLMSYRDKISGFFGKLFPKSEGNGLLSRASGFMRRFGNTFRERGLFAAMSEAGSTIKQKLDEWKKAFEQSPVGQKLTAFKNELVKIWNNLKTELGIDALVERFKNFFERLKKEFEENGLEGALNMIKETFLRKFEELKQVILQNEIVQKVLELKNRLHNAFADFAEKVGLAEKIEKFKEFFRNLKKIFQENGPITALTTLKNKIVQKIQQLAQGFSFTAIKAKIKLFFDQFVQSIKDANVGEAFDELKKAIKEKLSSLFPSPSEALEGGEEGPGFLETIQSKIDVWLSSLKEKLGKFDLDKIIGKLGIIFSTFVIGSLVLGIGKLATGLGELMSKLAGKKPERITDTITKTIRSLAISLLLLAAALAILALLPTDKLQGAIGALITCLSAIVLIAGMVKIGGLESAVKTLASVGIGLFGMAAAVMLIVIAINVLKSMDPLEFVYGLGLVGLIMVALAGVMALMDKYGGNNFKSDWKSILSVAGAVVIIAIAVRMLASLDLPSLAKGIVGMVAILGALFGFIVGVNKLGSTNGRIPKGIVTSVLGIAVALMLLMGPIKTLSKMPLDQLVKGIGGFAAILLSIFGFFAFMNKFGGMDNPMKIAGTLVSMIGIALLMAVFAEVLLKVANVPWETMLAFGASFAAVCLSVAGAVAIMSAIPLPMLAKGIVGLTAAIVLIGIALNLIAKLSGNTLQGLSENMFVVGANLSAFSDMVSGLNTDAIYTAIQIMKDFAAAAIEVGSDDYSGLDTFGNAMADIGSDLVIFSTLVGGLDTAAAATAFQIMRDFSAAAVEVSSAAYGESSVTDLGDVMMDVGADLAIFSGTVSGIDPSIGSTAATVMRDFSAAAIEVGGGDYSGLESFRSSLVQMGSGLRLYSTLTEGLTAPEENPLSTIAASIKDVHADMAQVTDIGDLTKAITNMGAAARLYYAEVGSIDTSKGVADLTGIGAAFSQLAANMPDQTSINDISSYAAGGGNDLTNFALGITAIGSAFGEFAKISESVNDEKVTAATTALDRIKTISTRMAPESVNFSFLGVLQSHQQDMTDFPSQITALGGALKAFANSIGGEDVNLDKVDQAITSLGKLQGIETALTGEGISWNWLTSLTDKKTQMDNFIEDIPKLGSALKSFGNSIGGDDVDTGKIDAATTVLGKLADINTALTGEGVSFDFFGILTPKRQDMTDFAEDITQLGGALASYATNIGGENVNLEKISQSTAIIEEFVKLQDKLAPIGGIIEWVTGRKDLGNFGSQMSSLGAGVARYADAISGKKFDNAEKSTAPLAALADIQAKLQNTGGIGDLFTGIKDLSSFGTQLKSLGEGVANFADAISGKKFDNAEAAIGPIKALADIQNSLGTTGALSSLFGEQSIANFGGKLETLGEKLNSFSTKVASVDILKGNQTVGFVRNLMNLSKEYTTNKDAKTGAENIISTLTALTSITSWGDGLAGMLQSLAVDFTEGLATELGNHTDTVSAAGGKLGLAAAAGASMYQGHFETVGWNMAVGLANGIYSGETVVYNAGHYVGGRAKDGAMNALSEASPSKEMFKVGMFADQGLAMGLLDYARLVEDAAGDTAKGALSEAGMMLAQLSTLMASDLDTTPTIRPVLDLSDIYTGIDTMNGMMPGSVRLGGLAPNLSAMRANAIGEIRTHNDDADIVDAINRIGERLDTLEETFSGLNVVLDTGATVGGIAPAMNREFGNMALLDERNI